MENSKSYLCSELSKASKGIFGFYADANTQDPGTLPACTPSSCAPCNIGASTMCISFPYGTIDEVTSTISVIPYVTQYNDGRLSTSFSTVTLDEDPECDFFEDDQFTWVTFGRTLTWPTTYGLLEGFVGRAESTFDPTKTSVRGKDCDGTVGTTAMTLPSSLDPGSFVIPLAATSTTFKAGPLPKNVIDYLDGFATVQEQFNEIPLISCAPALPVRTACTTVLTSISTTVSCSSTTGHEQSCTTLTEMLTETATHTPHWPTLNASLTDLKQTAARLTTETGKATTIQATAEPVLATTTGESTEGSSEEPTEERTDVPTQSNANSFSTASSSNAEVSEQSVKSGASPTSAATTAQTSTRTRTDAATASTNTESVSGPNTSETSQATGSAPLDSSAASSVRADVVATARCWGLVLLAALASIL